MPPRKRRRRAPVKEKALEQREGKLGWCMTLGKIEHERCWGETEFTICNCKCHKREETK